MHYRLGFSSKLENSSVYIECSVRKPGVNHPVREIVKRFGKKKDLLAQDPLALEKIQQEVDEMNRNCKGRQLVSSPSSLKSLNSDLSAFLEQQSLDKRAVFETQSAGCLILQRLYDQLKFDAKFDYIKKCSQFQYDLAKITKDLVLLRILNPASKRRSSIKGHRHYLGIDLDNLDHIYKSLDVLSEHKTDIVRYWNRQIGKEVSERDTSVCLYDITTYAFESTDADSLRDFGYSKDKKFNEVQVVMALATDKDGLPLDYGLYKGNQAEGATMVPFVDELKKKFNIKSFTVVADRGLNSKGNIDSLVKLGDNYVLSSKIRDASDDIKAQVLSEEGRIPMEKATEDGEIIDYGWYKEIHTDGPIKYDTPQYAFEEADEGKTRDLEAKLKHKKTASGKTVKSKLKRRYIITWTASRARKDKKDRERLIRKARGLVSKPADIKAGFKRGGRSYVLVDMDTESARIDDALIAEQSRFDGIHVVETSLEAPALEVVKIYKNLWKIEDSFRYLKSNFRARPVYVRLEDHIRGNFLICFLALCLHRFLEYKLKKENKKANTDQIIDGLNNALIALINPAKGIEFYGTCGFNAVVKDIMNVVGQLPPLTYEEAGSLRKKLRLYCAVRDLFGSTTTS
ncbi:IS1634 family transposase [Parasutterella excrementihominis]|jgi:transposase|uniref:IS1634 family transposase n=1 Tax=Parasutterella excrementihominis TaxID=487175 RepID=UPI0024323E10|nr:IS1634 family transposase [Parasutterella excrementihominis]